MTPTRPESAQARLAGTPAESPARHDHPWEAQATTALGVAFTVMPLTYVENPILGFRPSGWTWMLLLAVLAPAALSVPVPRAAVSRLAPYLAFLLFGTASIAWSSQYGLSERGSIQLLTQLAIPVLGYLLAWQIRDMGPLARVMRRSAWLGLATGLLLSLLTYGDAATGLLVTKRPMSMSVVALLLVLTVVARTRTELLAGTAVALTVTLVTGSRSASAILLLLVLMTPSRRGNLGGRLALILVIAAIVTAASGTSTFRERFFFTEDATLQDAVTLSPTLNTAGRRELWPKLLEQCGSVDDRGNGIGASYALSAELSDGGMTHPHNEFLRAYCDVGWPGSVLLWTFFALAGVRAVRRHVNAPPGSRVHAVAAQGVLALLLFGITDNPLAYTAQFFLPIAILLGLSERTGARRRAPSTEAALS